MSLPKFPSHDPDLTQENAINQILSSIAMEELALSHIINAEGEKIQYALGTLPEVSGPEEPATIEDLLNLNESVRETLDSVMQNQLFLKLKLQTALSVSKTQGTDNTLFIFQKSDSVTGQPLAGGTFQLSQNAAMVAMATSDTYGKVNFGVLSPGTYQMTETIPPVGYAPNPISYEVIVENDGSITVDGIVLRNFYVANIAEP